VCKADEDVMRVSKTCPQLEAAAETILQIHARLELENIRRRIDRENVQKHHVDQWEDAIGRFNDTLEKWNGVWNAVGSLSELVSSFYDLSYRSNADSRNVAVGREVRESNLPVYFFEFEKSNIAEISWNRAIAEGIMHAYEEPCSTPKLRVIKRDLMRRSRSKRRRKLQGARAIAKLMGWSPTRSSMLRQYKATSDMPLQEDPLLLNRIQRYERTGLSRQSELPFPVVSYTNILYDRRATSFARGVLA
jgi:hypothetical protein